MQLFVCKHFGCQCNWHDTAPDTGLTSLKTAFEFPWDMTIHSSPKFGQNHVTPGGSELHAVCWFDLTQRIRRKSEIHIYDIPSIVVLFCKHVLCETLLYCWRLWAWVACPKIVLKVAETLLCHHGKFYKQHSKHCVDCHRAPIYRFILQNFFFTCIKIKGLFKIACPNRSLY